MDLDDECQGILNSNIWNDSYPFFGDMSQEVYKVRWTVLQIATAFLLLSVTRFITNWDRYYKVRWLLQMRKYRVTFLWRHLCAALFNLLASQSWLIDWLLLSIFYLKRPRNVRFMLLAKNRCSLLLLIIFRHHLKLTCWQNVPGKMVTHLLVWPGVASSSFLPSSPPSF